jgi:hypothetical protein
MKRTKYSLIWVASLALLTQSSLFACSCGESSPPESFAQAREVFAGTVIDIAREPASPADPRYLANVEPPPPQIIIIPLYRVTFQVSETWKGSNTIIKVVVTGSGQGDCGVPFARGSDYLVYTSDTGFVHACSGTSLYFLASADLEFLGAGQKPPPPVLNVRREQSATIITWQTNWTDFHLEAARSFQPPVLWEPFTNRVGRLGRNYVVTNEMAFPGLFFRLAL